MSADNPKTTYCMGCGVERVALKPIIGGWYCHLCAAELKSKGIAK